VGEFISDPIYYPGIMEGQMPDPVRLTTSVRGRRLALLALGIEAAAILSGCYLAPYPYYGPGVAVVAPPHRCWRCW